MRRLLGILLVCSVFLFTSCSKEDDSVKVDIEEVEKMNYSSYIGVWVSNDESQSNMKFIPGIIIDILDVDKEFVTFSISVPQASGEVVETYEITSEISNGKTNFAYQDTFGGKGKGRLTFRESEIILVITTEEPSNQEYDISTNTKVYREHNKNNINEADKSDIDEIDITSVYFPVEGEYSNGSEGNFSYIVITRIDQASFKFAIYKGDTGELIFNQHIAAFEEKDATVAVYRGQNYTLYFDCSEYATITLTGFEEFIESPQNTFWNSTVLHSS